MNTRNVTIEQLAERINQTVWVKGDLKRIYLNDDIERKRNLLDVFAGMSIEQLRKEL